jgi:hypothetical protein
MATVTQMDYCRYKNTVRDYGRESAGKVVDAINKYGSEI